jgi:hypothetical protein
MSRSFYVLAAAALLMATADRLDAQRGGAPPAVPRAAAPIDLTGNWVALVTQDWRWRMVTPPKGDYRGIALNAEGRRLADAWDPAKDEAAGEECKSYGAPALTSVPGRLRISWQDDRTLKVEADAGMQTRLFHFDQPAPPGLASSWQGHSVAQWQMSRTNAPLVLRPADRGPGERAAAPVRSGALRVVTTNLRPGYHRKNGPPYSASTVLTEYWDLFKRSETDQLLTITTQVEDPQYLTQPRVIALPFKKEPNGAKWDPTPCSARW